MLKEIRQYFEHQNPERHVVLSFEKFIAFYRLNPERYDLHTPWVITNRIEGEPYTGLCTPVVCFKFLDYLRYLRFRKRIIGKYLGNKKVSKEMELTQELVNLIRRDIAEHDKGFAEYLERKGLSW